MIDALIPVRGLAEAVGRPHERQARLLGRFHIALRIADVDRVADIAALAQQAQRLSAKAQYLREYCVQLIELKDARADARRDATNLYLTVVASIFVPITTITGWYGMNFSNMPELSWEYGYATVIALSLVIIAAELAFFKWKKWL